LHVISADSGWVSHKTLARKTLTVTTSILIVPSLLKFKTVNLNFVSDSQKGRFIGWRRMVCDLDVTNKHDQFVGKENIKDQLVFEPGHKM
jgi:hypothetical protein